MIQQIMVYGIAVAAVLSMAALGLERIATLRGRPRRTAWILALLLSVLLPLFMIRRAEPVRTVVPVSAPAPMPATQPEPVVADLPAPRHGSNLSITPQTEMWQPEAQQPAQQLTQQSMLQSAPPPRAWHLPQFSDRNLLQAWAIASLLSGLYLVGAHLRLRRRITGWQRATLLGRSVLISETMGPALVGVFQPRMVVPRWLLDEPVTTQSLILEHERQHIGARDPLLIRAAVVLLAALPWNLPLWWQWRRMRQAIELDCDARVLRTGAEPRTYGEVLLAITGRATRMPYGVVAMSEPVSALERRIQNLLPDPVQHAALQVTGAVALLAAGASAAIAMDAPVLPARISLQTMSAPAVAATQPTLTSPMAIDVMPPTAAALASVLAAAAAAPATRTDSAQPEPIAPGDGMSPRDKVLRAAVQQHPELINGPSRPGPYVVTIVLRADGTVYRSSVVNLNIIPANLLERMDVGTGGAGATYGSGAMAGVVNQVLNRRVQGLRLSLDYQFTPVDRLVIEGPQTAKISKGQQVAGMGTASSDFEMHWRVLPADYDESRDSRRVTDVVRAKHDDLMIALPRGFQSPAPKINQLTVFMTEDGQMAREAVELLENWDYQSQNPRPVDGDSDDGGGGPYSAYNPPPVPAEAFKILGLDAAQIGQTGFLLVNMGPADSGNLRQPMQDLIREAISQRYLLVRYAWPRRSGEPIGGKAPATAAPTAQRTQFVPTAPAPLPQAATPIASAEPAQDLVQVSASDLVISASWAKRTDSYVLQLVLDRSAPMPRSEGTTTNPVTSANPITSLTREDMYRLGILNMADDRAPLVPQNSTPPQDRGSSFIANTTANLRGMDIWLVCGRTLTLVDGRRVVPTGQSAPPVRPAPAPRISYMNQPYPPEHKERRVDVWLLKTDGSQILPATYSCEAGPVSQPQGEPQHPIEVSYQFPVADGEQAVAAAIRIDDTYYIEKLQRPAPKPAAR